MNVPSLKYRILILCAPLVFLLDQITKRSILHTFSLGESVEVIPLFLNLTYIRNPGVAFGMLSQWESGRLVLTILPLMVLVGLFVWFMRFGNNEKLRPVAVALIAGGAMGNVLDRFRLGYVVDFLDFHWNNAAHYPAFNVADSAICVGVGFLFVHSWLYDKSVGKPSEAIR